MSLLPIALRGDALTVLVVGGGRVGARKARLFLDAGAQVRVVAPNVDPELLSATGRLELVTREFEDSDLNSIDVVVAATDDRTVNARVVQSCRERRLLCNCADDPADGSFDTVAVHRAGSLVIGVAAGGVPGAAARIRDEIARRFDARYADAVDSLARLRSSLRPSGRWSVAAEQLIARDFCEAVETGALAGRISQWD